MLAGNSALAVQYRQKAAVLSGSSVPAEIKSAVDADALYQKGLRLEYTDLNQAIGLWRQVVQIAPAHSDSYVNAAAKLAWYEKWQSTQTGSK